MIDLQVNLEGSLFKEDITYLADLQRIELPNKWEDLLHAKDRCKNRGDYLKFFELPLSLLQDVDAIEYAMYSLTCRLAKQGLLYAEIRFAPALHLRNHLTQDRAIKAALRGLYKGLNEYPDFNANLILVCMRECDLETNMITYKHAISFAKDNKVVALALAGDEKVKSCTYFKDIFALAKKNDFPFIIDAGENDNEQEVIDAVELGASRISHDISTNLNKNMSYYLSSHHVTFTLCPTQYVLSALLPDYESCPIKKYSYVGINAILCSGNLSINNTEIAKEYVHMIEHLYFKKEDVYEHLLKAIEASFLSAIEKGKLVNKLIARFNQYYSSLI